GTVGIDLQCPVVGPDGIAVLFDRCIRKAAIPVKFSRIWFYGDSSVVFRDGGIITALIIQRPCFPVVRLVAGWIYLKCAVKRPDCPVRILDREISPPLLENCVGISGIGGQCLIKDREGILEFFEMEKGPPLLIKGIGIIAFYPQCCVERCQCLLVLFLPGKRDTFVMVCFRKLPVDGDCMVECINRLIILVPLYVGKPFVVIGFRGFRLEGKN